MIVIDLGSTRPAVDRCLAAIAGGIDAAGAGRRRCADPSQGRGPVDHGAGGGSRPPEEPPRQGRGRRCADDGLDAEGGPGALLAAALRQRVLQRPAPRAERVHLGRQHHGAQLSGVQRGPDAGRQLHRHVPALLGGARLLRLPGRRAARRGGARDAPRRRGGRGDAGAPGLHRLAAGGRERPRHRRAAAGRRRAAAPHPRDVRRRTRAALLRAARRDRARERAPDGRDGAQPGRAGRDRPEDHARRGSVVADHAGRPAPVPAHARSPSRTACARRARRIPTCGRRSSSGRRPRPRCAPPTATTSPRCR